MKLSRRVFLGRSIAAVAALSAVAMLGGTQQGSAAPVNVDGSGLAIQGFDPVAYFTQNKAVPGKAEFSARHDGANYRFATAANLAAFEANPQKYAPAYGGYCAYGMAHGYKAKIEPEQFSIVNGRLYLNYNRSIKSRWVKDIPGFTARADSEWRNFASQ